MAGRDIVTIGTSSGGVEALVHLAGGLPGDLPAAVFVVLHFPEGAPSVLPGILTRSGPLKAVHPEDGDRIEGGRIYVAPPEVHMLVENDRVRLARGPKENHSRPAVDPLFRTAALAYGPRVVGVILTGVLDDGAAGMRAVKGRGGVAVVQDPDDALFRGMPESALRYADVDHSVPLGEMALLLNRLCREPVEEGGGYAMPDELEFEAKIAGLDPSVIDSGEHAGRLSGFTCPDCSGPLYEIEDGPLIRFRCRVGHAYSAEGMLDGKSRALEDALYSALNILEESADMSKKLAVRSREQASGHAATRFEERARKARERAEIIRRVLTDAAPPDAE